jgi:hypothetical protein
LNVGVLANPIDTRALQVRRGRTKATKRTAVAGKAFLQCRQVFAIEYATRVNGFHFPFKSGVGSLSIAFSG